MNSGSGAPMGTTTGILASESRHSAPRDDSDNDGGGFGPFVGLTLIVAIVLLAILWLLSGDNNDKHNKHRRKK